MAHWKPVLLRLMGRLLTPLPIILLTPQGRPFDQSVALELADHARIALICGRYEGVDERVRRYLCTDEISIGDFVLSGGEIAAMVIVDAVTRLLPGALGAEHGADEDSHATGLLEYPHYTRPPDFRGLRVPEVLISGHHANVARSAPSAVASTDRAPPSRSAGDGLAHRRRSGLPEAPGG